MIPKETHDFKEMYAKDPSMQKTYQGRLDVAHRFWTTVKGDRIVPLQRDFPNCEAKGNGCCYDNRKWWDDFQKNYEQDRSDNGPLETDIEVSNRIFIGSISKGNLDKQPNDFKDTNLSPL